MIASQSEQTARFFQGLFSPLKHFLTYISEDVIGVEVCAAAKMVAIACGLSYGMGYGDNTASLLMTRGLAEMSRLVAACGEAILMTMLGAGGCVKSLICYVHERAFT